MIRRIASRIRDYFLAPVLQKSQNETTLAVGQKALSVLYKQLHFSKCPPLTFRDVGFRAHSQQDEDGILLFIFSLIGTTNKQCVEICAGDGIECNTANLIINHTWVGLLCDGNIDNITKAKQYYAKNPDTKYWPPTIIQAWVTRNNVNNIIQENGFSDEIDLLSIDIDGNDYWLLAEISCISPRVIVLEFNHLWGPEASVTIPYQENFVAEYTPYGSDYFGASLKAFVKLNREKGYRFVGTNAIATNAFFVRNDISCDWLPEIDTTHCFDHPRAQFGIRHRLPGVTNREWVEV